MPRAGKRRTVERGIYQDGTGYEVVARAGRLRRSQRFESGTALATMRAWRDATASDLRDEQQPTADPSTLNAAIDRYIARTELPKDHAYRPSLNAWKAELGPLKRRAITPALVQQALDRWKHDDYSPQSLYYRRLVLEKVWKTLDGPRVKTPVDHIHIRRPKTPRPVWVPDATILAVARTLRRHEVKKQLHSAKTRARFLVLATTGQRPAQMKRAMPADVDLKRRIWWVEPAKGGERVPVYLNAEMRTAWTLFIRANAWGHYDTRSFARTLRHSGWPAGIRPYNLRHALGFSLSAKGADLGDIQLALGHTNPSTTRIYVGAIEKRMRKVSKRLDGRFRKGATRARLEWHGTQQSRTRRSGNSKR